MWGSRVEKDGKVGYCYLLCHEYYSSSHLIRVKVEARSRWERRGKVSNCGGNNRGGEGTERLLWGQWRRGKC